MRAALAAEEVALLGAEEAGLAIEGASAIGNLARSGARVARNWSDFLSPAERLAYIRQLPRHVSRRAEPLISEFVENPNHPPFVNSLHRQIPALRGPAPKWVAGIAPAGLLVASRGSAKGPQQQLVGVEPNPGPPKRSIPLAPKTGIRKPTPPVFDPLPGSRAPTIEAAMRKNMGETGHGKRLVGVETNPGPGKKTRGGSKAANRGRRGRARGGTVVNVNTRQNRGRGDRTPGPIAKLERAEVAASRRLSPCMRDPSRHIPPCLSSNTAIVCGWRRTMFSSATFTSWIFTAQPTMFTSATTSPIIWSGSTASAAVGTTYLNAFINEVEMKNLVNLGSTVQQSKGRCLAFNVSLSVKCNGNTRMPNLFSGHFLTANNTDLETPYVLPTSQAADALLNFSTIEEEHVKNTVSSSWCPHAVDEWTLRTVTADPTPTATNSVSTMYPVVMAVNVTSDCVMTAEYFAWFEYETNALNVNYGRNRSDVDLDLDTMFSLAPKPHDTTLRGSSRHSAQYRRGGASVSTLKTIPRAETTLEKTVRELKEQVAVLTSNDDKNDSECPGCHVVTGHPGLCDTCDLIIAQSRNTIDNNGITSVETTPEHVTRQIDLLKYQLTGKVPAVADLIKHGLGPTNKEMHSLNGNGQAATTTTTSSPTTTAGGEVLNVEDPPPDPPPMSDGDDDSTVSTQLPTDSRISSVYSMHKYTAHVQPKLESYAEDPPLDSGNNPNYPVHTAEQTKETVLCSLDTYIIRPLINLVLGYMGKKATIVPPVVEHWNNIRLLEFASYVADSTRLVSAMLGSMTPCFACDDAASYGHAAICHQMFGPSCGSTFECDDCGTTHTHECSVLTPCACRLVRMFLHKRAINIMPRNTDNVGGIAAMDWNLAGLASSLVMKYGIPSYALADDDALIVYLADYADKLGLNAYFPVDCEKPTFTFLQRAHRSVDLGMIAYQRLPGPVDLTRYGIESNPGPVKQVWRPAGTGNTTKPTGYERANVQIYKDLSSKLRGDVPHDDVTAQLAQRFATLHTEVDEAEIEPHLRKLFTDHEKPTVVIEKTRMINKKGRTKFVKHNQSQTYATATKAAKTMKPKKEAEPKVGMEKPPILAGDETVEFTGKPPLTLKQLAIQEALDEIELLEAESKLYKLRDADNTLGVHTLVGQSRCVIDNHLTRNIGVQVAPMVLDTRPFARYTRNEFGVTTFATPVYDLLWHPPLSVGCYIIVVPTTLLHEMEISALGLVTTPARLNEKPEELSKRLVEEEASYNVLVARCSRALKQIDVNPLIMRDALTWIPRLAWNNTYVVKQVTNPFNTLPHACSTVPKFAAMFQEEGYKSLDYMDPGFLPSRDQVIPDHCTVVQTCSREVNLACSSHPARLMAYLSSFNKKVDVDNFMATERIIHGLPPDRTKRVVLPPTRIMEGPETEPADFIRDFFRSVFEEDFAPPKDQSMHHTKNPKSVSTTTLPTRRVVAPPVKSLSLLERYNLWLRKRKRTAKMRENFSVNSELSSYLNPPVRSQISGNMGSWTNSDDHREYPYTEWFPASIPRMKTKSGYHYPNDFKKIKKNKGTQHVYAFNHPYRPVCYANTMENEEATMMTRVVVDTPEVDEDFMTEFISFVKKRFHSFMNYKVRKIRAVPWATYLERSNASPSVKLVLDRTMKEMVKAGFNPNDRLSPAILKKWTTRSLFLKKENLCYRSPFGEKDKAGRAISAAPPEFICATGPWHMAQQDYWKTIWDKNNWLCFVSGVNSRDAANVINVPWSFVEDDIGTFDSSVHERLGYLEVWVTQQFGAPRTVVDLGRANVKTHGTTFHGAKYWARGGRKSGDPFTSLYNSFLNAMMHAFIIHKSYGWSVPTIKANVRMLVAGDDNVMAINHKKPCDFVGMMKLLGFNSEALYRPDIFTVEFCSCRVYEIDDALFFGPMPGKVLSKLGFINTPPVNVSRESLIRGVAIGLRKLCNYLPPIRALVDRILELTQSTNAYVGPEAQFKGMDWQMDFTSFDTHMSPTVMASLYETYGWTPHLQNSLEASVAQLQLGDVISHPGFLLLCDRDTSAPAA